MTRLHYISHPNVLIDPDVPVPQWTLNEVGRRRAIAMLDQPWVASLERVVSSPEQKARETAGILADHLGLTVEVADDSGEIDRRSTGYVSHDRHEALASRLFARPSESADGWECAADAQARIVASLAPHLRPAAPVAVVGHGGVGTLLLTHLLGIAIDRSLDQPGQGHYWTWNAGLQRVEHRWRRVDDIAPLFAPDRPDREDIVDLLRAHLAFAREHSPPDHVHALDLDGLDHPAITFCSARSGGRSDGELLAVGALRDLGDGRAEVKSMHAPAAARGQGVGRAMLLHLADIAHSRGCDWLGLETGTMEAFAPARALYASFGFAECEPFGDYTRNEFSVCMSMRLA